jgi:Rrf2 family cysteine metabolism transcriptional repressor
MKLSSRSRYGFRAILELALDYGKGPMQIKTISDRESISNKYLEQLIAMLKASGLVRSMRGPKGGYVLSRHPSEIRLSEIFTTLEGPLLTVECLDHPEICPRCADCVTRDLWAEMQEAVLKVLEGKTLQDMVIAARKVAAKKGDHS